MSRAIEIEVKEWKSSDGALCGICREFTRVVAVIGEVQNRYGDTYDLCAAQLCLDAQLSDSAEEMAENWGNRKALAQEDHWNSRHEK